MTADFQAPEIIAVHIPKTAGSTFRLVLESVYGADNVEYDAWRQTPAARALRGDRVALNRAMEADVERRTSWPRVVTGHFPLRKYERFRRSAFTIVWLREPAARLLSQYFYYLRRHLTHPSPGPGASAYQRAELPPERLMEVEWPSNPITGRLLRGYDLDDLDYVGIQEHFAEDVHELGRVLGWPEVEIPVDNRTTMPEYLAFQPSDELLAKIRKANQADVELYEQALERRRARVAAGAQAASG